MAAIPNNNFAGATVTYNGVQFGGADSDHKSTPPQYSIRGDFVYDDAGRAVVGVRYLLTVQCVFHETTEAAMATNMADLRERLSSPGRELKIEGLGTQFGTITTDIMWGPKPIGLPQMNPLGQACWELVWTVEFMLCECASSGIDTYAWAAFNFSTTWRNDFEGRPTRTIAGYVQIAGRRNRTNPKLVTTTADQVRDRLMIIVPPFFRRVENAWDESPDRTRITFSVTDEMLPGDYLPEGCILADGDLSYSSKGPGFNEALVTLSMTIKTAIDKPASLAGLIFLTAATSKQADMSAGNQKGVVIPSSLNIANRKFDGARITSASMSWLCTRCINDMLNAAKIWQPVVPGDYNRWRTSIQHLWGNRSIANTRNLASDDLIVDLCSSVTQRTIGNVPADVPYRADLPQFTFTCPDIKPDGGWLAHDLRVRILREDEQTWHKKAVEYLPSPGQTLGLQSPGDEERVRLGGPAFTQSASEEHDVEYQGLPVTYVLLQFRGLRIKHKPAMPEIKSVAGQQAVLVRQEIDGPRVGFDVLTCPAWFIRGYRIYRVNGYVPDVKAVGSETSCAAGLQTQEY